MKSFKQTNESSALKHRVAWTSCSLPVWVTHVFGIMLVTCTGTVAQGAVINVDPGQSIQAAIDVANDGDEIVVAPGTYAPIDFLGKRLIIRSTGGPKVTIIDAAGGPTGVTLRNAEPDGTKLDGFTLTGGTGQTIPGTNWTGGGGMFITGDAHVVVQNSVITKNHLNSLKAFVIIGGGVYKGVSTVTFIDSEFSYNSADLLNGGLGGAIGSLFPTIGTVENTATFIRCSFIGNTQELSTVYVGNDLESSWYFDSCHFIGNIMEQSTDSFGGVLLMVTKHTSLTNCLFSGNIIQNNQGVLLSVAGGDTVIDHCTFTNNVTGSLLYVTLAAPISNSILYDNDLATFGRIFTSPFGGSTFNVKYSNIQGGHPGVGNIDAEPLFRDPLGPDGVAGTLDDDLRLLPFSPSAETGSNAATPADILDVDGDGDTTEALPFDIDGLARVLDADNDGTATTDMGAHEVPTNACEVVAYLDCDGNGREDSCDVFDGIGGPDCNGNFFIDSCEIENGTLKDCDGDGLADLCEIANGTAPDCDGNSIDDACDPDFDGDGTNDACDDDIDGDGVLNSADVCNATPLGAIVQPNGTLLMDGDGDCDVDLYDYSIFQAEFSGLNSN